MLFKQKGLPAGRQGFSIVELLITMGLAAIIFPALLTGFVATRGGRAQQDQRLQAIALAQETQEEIRVVRETGWDSLPIGTNFYPKVSGNSWILAVLPEDPPRTDGFTRVTNIEKVFRDADKKIADTGTEDPSTKKITTTVSWGNPIPYTVTNIQYLTRNTNEGYVETTLDDFNNVGATKTHVVVQPTGGSPTDGEIILGPGGGSDWCNPQQPGNVSTFDLANSGIPVAITSSTGSTQDLAFTTTGANSSGHSVDKITISHADPPIIDNPNFNNEAKSYGIFTDGTYVYFNENHPPNHTVRIASASDLSNIGYFDPASGNGTGISVYVSGDTGFTTSDNKLYAFDVQDKNGLRPQLGNALTLAGTGNRVVVVGSNAYVATSSTTNQLQIINVSDPGSMSITKSIDLGNGQGAVDVFVDTLEKYAYVVTNFSAGKNDFYIVDLNDTSQIYGYTTNIPSGDGAGDMTPQGVVVVPGDKALVVGCHGGKDKNGGNCSVNSTGYIYQVFDVGIPSAAFRCGGLNPEGVDSINAVSGVSQAGGDVYSHIITDNSSSEFQIIKGGVGGGAGGGTFATQGTYESQTIDLGQEVVFNSFVVNSQTAPPTTDIAYQTAISPASGGSCAGVTFSFVTRPPGAFPFSTTGQCLRFRAILSTAPDYSQTPTLFDITFNYSK